MRHRRVLAPTPLACGLTALACTGGSEAPRKEPVSKRAAKARARPPARPLQGVSKREACADSSLALLKWDVETLRAEFHSICCAGDALPPDDMECSLDWPFSDVPSCRAWAHMRNSVYARYGYPFEDPTWRRTVEKQPWYQRRDDFEPSWLTPVAQRNVERLRGYERDKVACLD